jgi:hypothetical protein
LAAVHVPRSRNQVHADAIGGGRRAFAERGLKAQRTIRGHVRVIRRTFNPTKNEELAEAVRPTPGGGVLL